MSDLIDRQAVIDLLKQMRKDGDMVPWEGKAVFARIRKLPTIQPEKAQLSQEGTTSDLISRQAAIDAINSWRGRFSEEYNEAIDDCENSIKELPPAQPKPTDINAKEAVYNLAEKIGIHQLFALTVELRGEPIQPEPQEGHWIDKGWDGDWAWQIDGRGNCWRVIECSECGKRVLVESNYCPHCGDKKKGAEHEAD